MCDLGLTSDEWGRLTPQEFAALTKRHRRREERKDQRVALLAAIIANANRDPKRRRKPYEVDDFMPKERQRKTPQQMLETVKVLHAAFGGRQVKT